MPSNRKREVLITIRGTRVSPMKETELHSHIMRGMINALNGETDDVTIEFEETT